MEVIFYNPGKSILKRGRDIEVLPRTDEHITFDGVHEYMVKMIIHDYQNQQIHVWLMNVTSNRVAWLFN